MRIQGFPLEFADTNWKIPKPPSILKSKQHILINITKLNIKSARAGGAQMKFRGVHVIFSALHLTCWCGQRSGLHSAPAGPAERSPAPSRLIEKQSSGGWWQLSSFFCFRAIQYRLALAKSKLWLLLLKLSSQFQHTVFEIVRFWKKLEVLGLIVSP